MPSHCPQSLCYRRFPTFGVRGGGNSKKRTQKTKNLNVLFSGRQSLEFLKVSLNLLHGTLVSAISNPATEKASKETEGHEEDAKGRSHMLQIEREADAESSKGRADD